MSYELIYESTNQRDLMKVIISSQYLYFFQESPPDPSTLDNKISLDDLAECRAAVGKTSELLSVGSQTCVSLRVSRRGCYRKEGEKVEERCSVISEWE